MDPELLRLLLEVLRDQQTTGSAATGGDWPYDDYGLQDTIGGIGAATPPPQAAAFGDGSIGAMTRRPSRYDTSPSTVGYDAQQARIEQRRPLADLLAAMQQGVGAGASEPQMAGLFGGGPVIERPQPQPQPQQVTPVAAPVAGTAQPPPKGTPTPDPRRDASTLPRKPDKSKQVQLRAPQAVQQITRQAVATQPQRQFSAPAPQRQYSAPAPVYTPAFTPAPASRSAPQNSLTNTLNLMRSLVRR